MKVKELKKRLEDFDENLEITFSDYDDDRNESQSFIEIDGIEQVQIGSKTELVVLYRG